MLKDRHFYWRIVITISFIFGFSAQSEGGEISLKFSELPSAQEWYYISYYYVPEDVFSVNGTELNLDTIGRGNVNAIYSRTDPWHPEHILDPTLPFSMRLRARLNNLEGNTAGLALSVFTGTSNYTITLWENVVGVAGIGTVEINTSQYHTYEIKALPNENRVELFVDGAFAKHGIPVRNPSTFPQISFGDNGSADNINADISELRIYGPAIGQWPGAVIDNGSDELCVNYQGHFDGSRSYDEDDNGCCITDYEWEFETPEGPVMRHGTKVDHCWGEPGKYKVTLTVKDDEGWTDDEYIFVDVVSKSPPCKNIEIKAMSWIPLLLLDE